MQKDANAERKSKDPSDKKDVKTLGKRKNGKTTDEQEAVEKKSKKGKINAESGQEKDDMQKKNAKTADKSASKSADDAKADKKQSKTSGSKPNHEKKSKETKKAKKSEVDVEAFPELQAQLCGWIHNNFTSYETLETVKEQCAAARGKYEYCRLNIYWHTFTCGLTMKKIGESKSYDIARFNIEKSLRGLVVAIACAEHMAPSLHPLYIHANISWIHGRIDRYQLLIVYGRCIVETYLCMVQLNMAHDNQMAVDCNPKSRTTVTPSTFRL